MRIRLGEQAVGSLRREEGGRWAFRTLASYRGAVARPVLGQVFEDDLERVWRSRNRLPAFFSNLLPEGPLRELLARELVVSPAKEGSLLLRVGRDLPGAIEVVPEEEDELPGEDLKLDAPGPSPEAAAGDRALKFSLAGVQLKLSVLEGERGLTVPASGAGGNWIVKLPLDRHPELPAVELAILLWARQAGFEVPDLRLVRVEEIGGLPPDWPVREGEALAVRRYDRTEEGSKIHQEDFAQVLDLYPEKKYGEASYDTLGRILLALTGETGLMEFVRRLVFMVLSGNGDAHLKNWSLVYPDRRTARLSPLYDTVFTRAFIPNDALALSLAGEKQFHRVGPNRFRRFARRVGADSERVLDQVHSSSQAIRGAWRSVRADLPLSGRVRELLDAHLGRVRL